MNAIQRQRKPWFRTPRITAFGAGLAFTFVLALSALPVHAEEEGETVSRAEYEALREELRELRSQVEELRGQAEEPPGEPERPLREEPEAPEDRVIVEWDRALTFSEPEGRFSLSIGGRLQPRYQYERREGQSNHSSFSFRRLRLQFGGHAYSRDLTYRVTPELSRTASLRDGWVNYKLHDSVQVRIGQYNVPFAWERDSSSSRHQFVERSIANNEFQWNDGRDLGVMFHGNLNDRVRYATGVFGGEGRNTSATASEGNLYTGRLTYAPVGAYPRAEALVSPVEGTNMAFGLGASYANQNAGRDWHPWSDADTGEPAHVFAGTADFHFQAGRFASHLMGFFRDVDPLREAPYDGFGASWQAGYLLLPGRLFGSLRYSYSEPNTDEKQSRKREMMMGLQIFHSGHGSKLHLETGRIQNHDGHDWRDTDLIRVQYQLLF